MMDDAVLAAAAALRDPGLEDDPGDQARLDAIQQLYLEREAGAAGTWSLFTLTSTIEARTGPPPVSTSTDEAARRGEVPPLGPVGRRHAEALLAAIGLEQGRWQGRPVDVPLLEGLLQAGDEEALRRSAARLPDGPLRAEARRRLVRLRLRTSPFPEVRRDAAAVEEKVMRLGANPIALREHPPVSSRLDPAGVPARRVLVEEKVEQQTARLLGDAADRPEISVFPEVPLRGALQVELRGLSRTVTLCAPARELEVAPCLAPGDIRPASPVARVDGDGALRLADALEMPAAVDLAKRGGSLAVPIEIGGRRLAALEWPLAFRTTGPLVLEGAGAGERGPDLAVQVDRRDPRRLVYAVAAPGRRYQAVVEWVDAASFQVASRGGAGARGWAGSSGIGGTWGASGSSASCPSSPGSDGQRGGDGGAGGAGGPGGPGGDGGDVAVTLVSGADQRQETLLLIRATVLSQGGAGGAGGAGGSGGSGGTGGSGGLGTSCSDADGRVTFLSGGSSGPSGSSGPAGPDGPNGPPGRPGRVIFPAR
jgi:hypothetical protein